MIFVFVSDTFQALNERYPLDSDTCATEARWDPEVETGGGCELSFNA